MLAPPYLNFLGFEEAPAPGDARFRVLPLPYDLTTSYQPGARRGPLALLEASTHLEWYDEELELEPAAAGIATLRPLEAETSGPRAMLERVARVARPWVEDGRFLLGIGGEHSLSAPLVAVHREVWPELTVLQVDAHADLREAFEGSPHNHASVMRRIAEAGGRIVQVGVRSLTRDEHEFIRTTEAVTTFFAHELAGRPAAEWASEVAASIEGLVYITIDLDGFDPSIMPSTGTPEPGGLSWREVTELLARVTQAHRCVGADVVELAPLPGLVAPDFLAAKLAYRLMGLVGLANGWLERE